MVTLEPITKDNVRAVCELEVAPEQRRYVAPTATTIAEAQFFDEAWLRAVYADGEPVGLIALGLQPEQREYFLWRLSIAREHQRRGYGRAALHAALAHVRTLPGATELLTSYVPGDHEPRGFYEALGFVDTGQVSEGERVMRLTLG